MSWGEAFRLTQLLAADPASQVFAALAEWSFPVSREWIVAADHRDSTEYGRIGRRAHPYPRPWLEKTKTRIGHGRGSSSSEQLHARIARHQHAHVARQEATDG